MVSNFTTLSNTLYLLDLLRGGVLHGFVLGILLACAGIYANPALGIGPLEAIGISTFSKHDSLRVFTHQSSSQSKDEALAEGLSLFSTPHSRILKHLQVLGLDEGIEISLEGSHRSHHGEHQTYQYSFKKDGLPICEHQIKAHIFSGAAPTITGTIPLVKTAYDYFPTSAWLPVSEIMALTRNSSELVSQPELIKLNDASRCLYSFEGRLVPAWKILFSYMGLNYAIFRDSNEIYKFENRFFQVDGTTQSYQVNPVDSSGLVTESFELIGDTFLTSEKLTTKPNGVDRISSDQHNFILDPDHENFPEVNVFSQVARMIAWFEDKSFQWKEGQQLTLKIHESIMTDSGPNPNNALYLPAEYNAPDVPSITLGDGDGTHLTNLALDADVSGHELGHHVIFQSVKSTQQVEEEDGSEDLTDHSGAIHEGLADFFMFAKSGNSCLGESICPGNGAICSQQGQCLRNADNDLTYGSAEYWSIGNKLYHLKGQLVSGLLWDIRNDSKVSPSEFDGLVVKAIDFLDPRSTYSNLLLALVISDHQFYQGKYVCSIVEKAKARGFEEQINEIVPDCFNFVPDDDYEFANNNQLPTVGDSTTVDETATTNPIAEIKKTEKRSKPEATDILCGSISLNGNQPHSSFTYIFFIFLFIFPLVIAQSLQRMFRT